MHVCGLFFNVWWLDHVCTACKQVKFNATPELNMIPGSFLTGFSWVQPTVPVLFKNGTGVLFRESVYKPKHLWIKSLQPLRSTNTRRHQNWSSAIMESILCRYPWAVTKPELVIRYVRKRLCTLLCMQYISSKGVETFPWLV